MQQVNRSNIQSIVQQLLAYLVKGSSTLPGAAQSLLQNASANAPAGLTPNQSSVFRLVLSQRILAIGSQSTYENVTNFEWYLSVLVDLAHIANVDIGAEICDQLVDVVGRVRAVRPYGIKLMTTLLANESMLRNAREPGSCSEVLWAAAWISGEYCEQVHIFFFIFSLLTISSSLLSDPQKLLPHLLQSEVDRLSPNIIAVYIQATLKVFGNWATEIAQRWDEDNLQDLKDNIKSIIERMQKLVNSQHIEVQERVHKFSFFKHFND